MPAGPLAEWDCVATPPTPGAVCWELGTVGELGWDVPGAKVLVWGEWRYAVLLFIQGVGDGYDMVRN